MSILYRSIAAALVALLLLIISTPANGVGSEQYRIVMLTSQKASPYNEVLSGFRHYLNQQKPNITFEEYAVQSDSTKAIKILQTVKKDPVDVLLTVGSLATQVALREARELPIIACLILNADEIQRAPNATGVVIDFPVEIQFQWMRRFLPENRSVGVLFDPQENQTKIEVATRVADNLGLRLVPREVRAPQALPDALDSLARDTDVLWGLADHTALSPQTAESVLLFSFRNRIPFAGLSSSWVKAGALYALDRDYADLGMQCGEIALKVLQGIRAGSIPLASPRKVVYALNLKTARHMKLEISQALIDGAQQIFQ